MNRQLGLRNTFILTLTDNAGVEVWRFRNRFRARPAMNWIEAIFPMLREYDYEQD